MQFAENEITQLTTAIWDSILRMPLDAASAQPQPDEVRRHMAACVQITGAWQGAVTLDCDAAFAAEAAAVMFDLATATAASTADMQDALGELANMIGGNVKGLLPEPCHLSLPAVVDGERYSARVPGSRVLMRIPLRSGPHPINICLLQREEAA